MKKQYYYAITVLVVAAALVFYVNSSLARPGEDRKTGPGKIELSFFPMPQTELAAIEFDSAWNLLDSRIVNNIAGVQQVLVSFYRVDEDNISLILQDREGFYDLEMAVEGEPDRIAVYTRDMNNDGANELVIMADRGTTYKEVKVYTYNGEKWVCLLATENLISADLNADGTDELVTTSMGSLPGYIWIYRWNGSVFEKSDVTENTGNIYAALVTLDGKTLIETGKANEPRYYQYSDGKLVEVQR